MRQLETMTPEYENKFREIYFRGLAAYDIAQENKAKFRRSIEKYHIEQMVTEAAGSNHEFISNKPERQRYKCKRNKLGELVTTANGKESRNTLGSKPIDYDIRTTEAQLMALYFDKIRPHLDNVVTTKNLPVLKVRYAFSSSFTEAVNRFVENSKKPSRKRIEKMIERAQNDISITGRRQRSIV